MYIHGANKTSYNVSLQNAFRNFCKGPTYLLKCIGPYIDCNMLNIDVDNACGIKETDLLIKISSLFV